jgi:hypothetical protein
LRTIWGFSSVTISKTAVCLSVVFVIAGLFAGVASARQRPLLTEDPRVIPEGAMDLENGIGYFNRARFPVSGLGGNHLSILDGGALFGFGRAEFQMRGTLRNNLWVTEGGSGLRADWGDGEIATKIALLTESGRLPDLSFRPKVILPNASNEDGLGTDGTHFFAEILVGKSAGPAYVFGSIGLGILDDAERAAAQQDVMTYGFATIVSVFERVRIAAEINGLTNPQSNPTLGGEDRAQTRFGLQWDALGMEWDAAVTAGLTDVDHRVGFVFGTTRRFTLWQ